MVLTVSFALSLATGLSCHHRRRKLVFANLTPASGRQDHATSPSAGRRVRLRAVNVHRIPRPTFVTIAKRPFVWAGTLESIKLFLPGGEAKYFLNWGWTALPGICPSGKSAACPP
jgi:hypothetical protein